MGFGVYGFFAWSLEFGLRGLGLRKEKLTDRRRARETRELQVRLPVKALDGELSDSHTYVLTYIYIYIYIYIYTYMSICIYHVCVMMET